jgi:hypothetical protein
MGGLFIRDPIGYHDGSTASRDGITPSRGLVKLFSSDRQHDFGDGNDRINRSQQPE